MRRMTFLQDDGETLTRPKNDNRTGLTKINTGSFVSAKIARFQLGQ